MPGSEHAFANLHVMKRISPLVPKAKYRREQTVYLKSKPGNFPSLHFSPPWMMAPWTLLGLYLWMMLEVHL
eukprot:5579729-Ditylum_brightwellii.AAC.1